MCVVVRDRSISGQSLDRAAEFLFTLSQPTLGKEPREEFLRKVLRIMRAMSTVPDVGIQRRPVVPAESLQ